MALVGDKAKGQKCMVKETFDPAAKKYQQFIAPTVAAKGDEANIKYPNVRYAKMSFRIAVDIYGPSAEKQPLVDQF
jgi:hypothetical protein